VVRLFFFRLVIVADPRCRNHLLIEARKARGPQWDDNTEMYVRSRGRGMRLIVSTGTKSIVDPHCTTNPPVPHRKHQSNYHPSYVRRRFRRAHGSNKRDRRVPAGEAWPRLRFPLSIRPHRQRSTHYPLNPRSREGVFRPCRARRGGYRRVRCSSRGRYLLRLRMGCQRGEVCRRRWIRRGCRRFRG
jgi:hypothetical protein